MKYVFLNNDQISHDSCDDCEKNILCEHFQFRLGRSKLETQIMKNINKFKKNKGQ